MKVVVSQVPVDFDERGVFAVQLRAPGIVRHVAWGMTKNLVMQQGRPDFSERLIMFVEMGPDAPLHNHTFVVLKPGHALETPPDFRHEFVGTALSLNTGALAHLYELVQAPPALVSIH